MFGTPANNQPQSGSSTSGQPQTGGTGTSLFGGPAQAGNNAPTAGGGPAPNGSNPSGTSLFSNPNTGSAFGGASSFGGAAPNTAASTGAFGNTLAANSTGFGNSAGLFGNQSSQTSATGTQSGGVGGFGSMNASSEPAKTGSFNFSKPAAGAGTTGSGAGKPFSFGTGAPQTSTTSGSIFGNNQSTPAAGSTTAASSGGLFGGSAPTSTSGATGSGTFQFGGQGSSQTFKTATNATATPAGSTTSITSGQPAASGAQPKSLFGSTTTAAPPSTSTPESTSTGAHKPIGTFSFDAKPNTQAAPDGDAAAKKPSFGFSLNTESSNAASQGNASKPTTSLFGATKDASNTGKPSIFGNSAGASGATKPAAGLFGAANKNEEPKPASGGIFGGSTAGTNGAPKPAPTGLFGGASSGAAASAAPATGPFGNKDIKPGTTTSTAPSTGLFGNNKPDQKPAGAFSFGTTPTAPAPTSSTPGSSEPAKPSLFGAKQDVAKDAGAGAGAVTAAPSSALGGKPGETASDDKNKPALSFGTTPKPEQKEGAKEPASATSAVDTSKAEITPAVYLRNKSFGDIISKWTSALAEYTGTFKNEAAEIAASDKILVSNGTKIANIFGDVVAASMNQARIDDLLSYVDKQQDDLDAMLDKYEKQLNEVFPEGDSGRLQPVDQERQETYGLAVKLNEKLNGLEGDLATITNEINSATKQTYSSQDEDPITQIVSILNSHLASLEWIDENASKLQDKLALAYTQTSHVQFK